MSVAHPLGHGHPMGVRVRTRNGARPEGSRAVDAAGIGVRAAQSACAAAFSASACSATTSSASPTSSGRAHTPTLRRPFLL
jgi:hypothetical protein